MPLIQGTVEYTTPRPFESASARVSLSFAFVEGEDVNTQISNVARLAEAHAKAMIGAPLQVNEQGPWQNYAVRPLPTSVMAGMPGAGPEAPGATVIGSVPRGTDGGAVLNALGLPGAAPGPIAAAVPPETAAPVPSPASNVVQLPGQPSPVTTTLPGSATSPVEASSQSASPSPVAGISDSDLVTAITHRNSALLPVYGEGSAQKICDLVAEFVAPPAKAYAIPSAQRQAFLDRLAALA